MTTNSATTDRDRIIHHPNMPLSAPAWAWRAADFDVYATSDTVGDCRLGPLVDELLLRALGRGLNGAPALAWVREEITRKTEEQTRQRAAEKLADALRHVHGTVSLDAAPLVAAIRALVKYGA